MLEGYILTLINYCQLAVCVVCGGARDRRFQCDHRVPVLRGVCPCADYESATQYCAHV